MHLQLFIYIISMYSVGRRSGSLAPPSHLLHGRIGPKERVNAGEAKSEPVAMVDEMMSRMVILHGL